MNSAGGGPDGVAAAHRALLNDKALQFDFPAFKPPEPPAWTEWIAKLLAAIAPFLNILFWAATALVVGGVLFLIVREILRRSGEASGAGRRVTIPIMDFRPTAEQARVLLADADALAEKGQFAEAAHLLLLRGVQDIRDRRPGLVRPALTSRDIAGLGELPDQARGAFGAIAAVVERSFFGGRDVGGDDWRACRRAYEAFALEGTPR